MGRLTNAKIYYGLHFAPGVAEYKDSPDAAPYRILIEPDVMKQMDPTMNGNPIYVQHVMEVKVNQNEPDGRVVESFFNQPDGMHWAKFLSETDESETAIANHWTLSNAYHPVYEETPGQWHGVEYSKKVMNGEFEHLALVPNPRYQESVILTPDQFKQYNENLLLKAETLRNSKENENMDFKFWKVVKNEDAKFDPNVFTTLPKSKKEVNVLKVLNDMDTSLAGNPENMADLGGKVKLHDDSMCNVGELLEKHKEAHEMLNAYKEKYGDMEKPTADDEVHQNETEEEKEAREKKENEDKDEKDKKEKEDKDKKENAAKKAAALKNARETNTDIFNSYETPGAVHLESDGLALGKKLF